MIVGASFKIIWRRRKRRRKIRGGGGGIKYKYQ